MKRIWSILHRRDFRSVMCADCAGHCHGMLSGHVHSRFQLVSMGWREDPRVVQASGRGRD